MVKLGSSPPEPCDETSRYKVLSVIQSKRNGNLKANSAAPPMHRKLRIVMIVSGYPPAKKAGMESGCKRLAEALARRGHSVKVLTAATRGLPRLQHEATNLVVHRVLRPIPLGPLWGVSYMAMIKSWLLRHVFGWDVVVCHKLGLHGAVAAPLARIFGRQCHHLAVNAGHYGDVPRLRAHLGGGFLLALARLATGCFHLSADGRRELQNAGFRAAQLHPFIYHVMPSSPPFAERRDAEVLFLGRLHRQKNLPLLLKAFAAVARDRPGARLRIVGSGPLGDALRRAVAASTAAGRIQLDPWTDEPRTALQRSALFVLPSRSEGLSNALLEAMVEGCAIIATDVSGVRDALDPTGASAAPVPEGGFLQLPAGLLVRSGDHRGLAAAMAVLLDDGPLRERLGNAARAIALEHFSEERAVALFLAAMEPPA